MGLAIAAYRTITPVNRADYLDGDELDEDRVFTDDVYEMMTYASFPHAFIGITDTSKVGHAGPAFIRGPLVKCSDRLPYDQSPHWSYSGYNRWRDDLARLVFGVPADTVFFDFDRYRHDGVSWLINFSDCEGDFGPEACKVIRGGLAAHPDITMIDEYGQQQLDRVRGAFEHAANGGMVSFR